MDCIMLRSKLHQARVSSADLNYVGSITIPQDILDASDMFPYEKVLIANIDNGERFETYILPGKAGDGFIQLNGAAARCACVGDKLIIMAFSSVSYPPPADWAPRVLVLDEKNAVVSASGGRK